MDILSKLKPQPVEVEVKLPYGRVETFEVVVPTFLEWQDIEGSVLNPPVPMRTIGQRKEADHNDVVYRRKMSEANARRQAKIVTQALVKAGGELPGNDLDAKTDALAAAAEAGIIIALYNFLQSTLNATGEKLTESEEAANRADGFHGLQKAGDAHPVGVADSD